MIADSAIVICFVTTTLDEACEHVFSTIEWHNSPQVFIFVCDPANHDGPGIPEIVGTCLAFESSRGIVVVGFFRSFGVGVNSPNRCDFVDVVCVKGTDGQCLLYLVAFDMPAQEFRP